MGFTLEVEAGQKGRLVAGHPGDVPATFIDAIRSALNQRITSFQVDLTAEPESLNAILEPLKKLQQLVGSRGQAVAVVGSGLLSQAPLYKELKKAGVAFPDIVVEGGGSVDTPLADGEIISEELKIVFKELDTDFGGELVLPPPERVSPHMLAVQGRLAGLLKMEENLKAEEETLLHRLTYLKKREPPGGAKNMDEYQSILSEEKQIDELRESIHKLKKELVVAKEAATNQEKVFKDYTGRVDMENRKKQDALKKELHQLQENLKKANAELEKKQPKGNP